MTTTKVELLPRDLRRRPAYEAYNVGSGIAMATLSYENMLGIVDMVETHVDATHKIILAAVIRMLESLHVNIAEPAEQPASGEPHGEIENF